jgi:hypothetical protein
MIELMPFSKRAHESANLTQTSVAHVLVQLPPSAHRVCHITGFVRTGFVRTGKTILFVENRLFKIHFLI